MGDKRFERLRKLLAVLVVGLLIWIIVGQLRHNWAALVTYHFQLAFGPLALGLALATASFLCDTLSWRMALNGLLRRRELGFVESVAFANTSGLLKYLPGRVWTYGAQMLWLAQRGVSKSTVAYGNLLCLMYSTLVSLTLGASYVLVYRCPPGWAKFLWPALVVAHFVALVVGPRILNLALGLVKRLAKREVSVSPAPLRLLLALDLLSIASWTLIGVAAYYVGVGVGLKLTLLDVLAISASMSIAWLAGYASALTPGGLGVREALMFLMLEHVSHPETAVILPLMSRLLYLVIEIGLGAIGFAIGARRKLFSAQRPA